MFKSKKLLYVTGVCGIVLSTMSAALPIGGVSGAPQQAQIVTAANPSTITDDTPLTITLHKYESKANDSTKNDGEEHEITDRRPLPGVRFTITKVKPTNKQSDMKANDASTFTKEGADKTGVTDTNGELKFELGTFATGKGIYLIHEEPSAGVKAGEDFFVQLPLTKADGSGLLTDVNIYPKNDLDDTKMNPSKVFTGNGQKEEKIQKGQEVKWNLTIDVPALAYQPAKGDTPEQFAQAIYLLDPVDKHLTPKTATGDVVGTLSDGTSLTEGTDFTVQNQGETPLAGYNTIRIDLTHEGMKKAAGKKATFVLKTVVEDFRVNADGIPVPIINTFDSHYTPSTGIDVPETTVPGGTTDPNNPDKPTTPDPDPDPENPDPGTPTIVFGRIDMKKIAAEDSTPLAGATFKIAESEAEAKAGQFVKEFKDGVATDKDLELTTGEDGMAKLDGLKNDQKYYLVETKAPKGYELTDEIFEVTALPDDTQDAEVQDKKDVVQEFLPMTGGQLRLLLMVAGTTMILVSGTALYLKKRKEA